MAIFDEQLDRVVSGMDQVLKNRINQLDGVFETRLNQLQEMLNGVKITVNVEMPMVKKATPV